MKLVWHRKHLLIIIIVTLLGVLLAYASWEVVGKNVCPVRSTGDLITQEYLDCKLIYFDNLYYPFSQGLLLHAVALSALLLMFFSERVYKVWRWFAGVGIFFAILGITRFDDRGFDFLLDTKAHVSNLFGALFLAATVLIIIVVTVVHKMRIRKQKTKLK